MPPWNEWLSVSIFSGSSPLIEDNFGCQAVSCEIPNHFLINLVVSSWSKVWIRRIFVVCWTDPIFFLENCIIICFNVMGPCHVINTLFHVEWFCSFKVILSSKHGQVIMFIVKLRIFCNFLVKFNKRIIKMSFHDISSHDFEQRHACWKFILIKLINLISIKLMLLKCASKTFILSVLMNSPSIFDSIFSIFCN